MYIFCFTPFFPLKNMFIPCITTTHHIISYNTRDIDISIKKVSSPCNLGDQILSWTTPCFKTLLCSRQENMIGRNVRVFHWHEEDFKNGLYYCICRVIVQMIIVLHPAILLLHISFRELPLVSKLYYAQDKKIWLGGMSESSVYWRNQS